jgi:hypothetical protein
MEKIDRVRTAHNPDKAAVLKRANTQTARRYGLGGLKTSAKATRKISLARTPWDYEKPE